MKPKKTLLLMIKIGAAVLLTGCAMFRYTIVPQENKGPHGGALSYIDKRFPEYVEFVAIPGKPEWTMQVYVYDKNMKQRSFCGSGYLRVELSEGTGKGVALLSTAPYFWSKGKGYLENKIQLGDIKEFRAKVSIVHGKSRHRLVFLYPY